MYILANHIWNFLFFDKEVYSKEITSVQAIILSTETDLSQNMLTRIVDKNEKHEQNMRYHQEAVRN